MTIRRMRIACWITKATNTHSECVTLIAFPLQQRLHERASMLRCTYIACRPVYHWQLNVNNTAGIPQCTFGVHKIRGNSGSAKKLLASPVALCYKQSVGSLYFMLFKSGPWQGLHTLNVKPTCMKRTGHAGCTGKTTNAYKVLIVKFHTKVLLERYEHRAYKQCPSVCNALTFKNLASHI